MEDSSKSVEQQKIEDFKRRFSELQMEATRNILLTENEVGEIAQTAKKKVQMKTK
jgi:hypothetical protein